MKQITLSLQHRKKSVTDNELLEMYFDKQVFFEQEDSVDAYSGKISKIGETFVYFTDIKSYKRSIEYLSTCDEGSLVSLEYALNDFKKLPDMTINLSQIERIVLAKDILKLLKENKK